MATATLRKVGGSEMVAIPRPVLDELGLASGAVFEVDVRDGKVVLEPKRRRKKYTLEELLAQCDPDVPLTDEERAWLDTPPVGREIW